MSEKLERPAKELCIGDKYGNLVAIDGPRRNERGAWMYKFKCEAKKEDGSICGKEIWKEKNRIKGRMSCGCLRGARTDLLIKNPEAFIKKEGEVKPPPRIHDKSRIVFGEPIDFRGLLHAPLNEQGVVYLFGMVSQELGYRIESIRTKYPDCEGKRCFDPKKSRWEPVRIEFEYKSSHFRHHKHNPDQCDVIVCWEDDWKDRPLKGSPEVLELRRIIKSLK